MFRALLWLALGGMAGVASAWFVWPPGSLWPDPVLDAASGSAGVATAAEVPTESEIAWSASHADTRPVLDATHSGFASLQLSFFEAVAQTTSFDELERSIAFVAALSRSRARDAELHALLLRYAELDPARAVAFAWSQSLESRFLVPLYRVWASVDAGAAIARLRDLTPAVEVRELALAVLSVIGMDQRSVARVAAALPAADRFGLDLDVLTLRAQTDPEGALRALAGVDPAWRTLILTRLVPEIARTGPRQAFMLVSTIGDVTLRTAAQGLVLGTWAEVDPEAVFDLLESLRADSPPDDDPVLALLRTGQVVGTLMQRVAERDPERLFHLSEHFVPTIKAQGQRAALRAMAESDPLGALARIEAVPLGQERSAIINSIASAWGRTDPGAALAWARSISSSFPQALRGVITGIAAVDLDYAIDILQSELAGRGAGMQSTDLSLMSSVTGNLSLRLLTSSIDATEVGRFVDRLLEFDVPVTAMTLGSTINAWMQLDPDGAMRWMSANSARLNPSIVSMAAQMAVQQHQADRVIGLMDSLPVATRASLMQGVAVGLAGFDADRAMEFLDRYRGQPGYDAGLANVINVTAQTNPSAAARILDASGSPQAMQTVGLITHSWAQRDPASAAQWVSGLQDENVRANALSSVATSWASTDAESARLWISTLEQGTARDRAIAGYLTAAAAQQDVSGSLLFNYFSSEQARNVTLQSVLMQIGTRSPSQARQLLDAWVHDPQLHQQIGEMIARATRPDPTSGAGIQIGTP